MMVDSKFSQFYIEEHEIVPIFRHMFSQTAEPLPIVTSEIVSLSKMPFLNNQPSDGPVASNSDNLQKASPALMHVTFICSFYCFCFHFLEMCCFH